MLSWAGQRRQVLACLLVEAGAPQGAGVHLGAELGGCRRLSLPPPGSGRLVASRLQHSAGQCRSEDDGGFTGVCFGPSSTGRNEGGRRAPRHLGAHGQDAQLVWPDPQTDPPRAPDAVVRRGPSCVGGRRESGPRPMGGSARGTPALIRRSGVPTPPPAPPGSPPGSRSRPPRAGSVPAPPATAREAR